MATDKGGWATSPTTSPAGRGVTKKPPVHVLSRNDGWAVVREGKDRATSVHPTQAEAAKEGREIARKDGTEFLLHAKDGRVRDRSDYGEDQSAKRGEPKSPVAGVASAATRETGGAVGQASGIVGGAVDGLGRAATGTNQTAGERPDDTEGVGGLAYAERYADYEVYDRGDERLGKVDALFLDENDRPEYLGVRMGLLGTRSTLLPWAAVTRADEEGGRLEVNVDKETAKNGPAFEDGQEITPELEREVHGHYGLEQAAGAEDRGAYGDYYSGTEQTSATTGTSGPDTVGLGKGMGSTEADAFREHDRGGGNLREPGTDPEDEIRVRRSEEELRVDTTRREAGALRVRKRVRTELESVEVPVRREEVYVERVPVSREASAEIKIGEDEIGEDEIVVPVIEEEVVVEKRPVVKEEVRIRKDVVEDTEVVEEDVRREEIDVDDQTTRREV
jgi:uncharacterized protein (TIGR02271 family)